MAHADDHDYDWDERPASPGEPPGLPEYCPPFTHRDDDPTLPSMTVILPYRPRVRDPFTVYVVHEEGRWVEKGLENVTLDDYRQTFKNGQVHVID